jgi:hypothetical protein
VTPKSLAASPEGLRIGPGWAWCALIGIAVNLAGGCVWLGVGPALFITGGLAVALSYGWIALFFWFSARVVSARRSERPADERPPKRSR